MSEYTSVSDFSYPIGPYTAEEQLERDDLGWEVSDAVFDPTSEDSEYPRPFKSGAKLKGALVQCVRTRDILAPILESSPPTINTSELDTSVNVRTDKSLRNMFNIGVAGVQECHNLRPVVRRGGAHEDLSTEELRELHAIFEHKK